MAREDQESWHLDKRVPVALIATLGVYLMAAIYAYGQLSQRVNSIELAVGQQSAQIEAIKQATNLRDSRLARIEAILERIEARLDRNDRE